MIDLPVTDPTAERRRRATSRTAAGTLLTLWILAVATPALADSTHDLHLAARSGDLDAVRQLVDSGVPVDVADPWGTTALLLAAKNNQIEVSRYLLDQGADPSARETFFGATPLGMALWKGGPDYQLARLLLAAGAIDRAEAIVHGLEIGDLALAQAAIESGTILASQASDLRSRDDAEDPLIAALLTRLTVVPDPPPPNYSPRELAEFTGYFANEDDDAVRVELRDGRLMLDRPDSEGVELTATAERSFTHSPSGIEVSYFGRAGTVEGLVVEIPEREPLRLRVADPPEDSSPSQTSAASAGNSAPSAGATAAAVPTTAERRVHWPGFRGANRDGIGDAAIDPPIDFDLESGAGIAWVADLPGLGNSSPVVWGDRVYVTTAIAEGGSVPLKVGRTGSGEEVTEDSVHRWVVLAFDKSSGERLWKTEVGRGVPLTHRHFKATQANSSPVTDGDHVVVVFPTAGLACLGVDGSVHWKHDLGGLNAGGFNDPGMQWGFASSPILHDGKVVLQVDIHGGPYLAAWSLETGKPLWKTERPEVAPSWATPAVWSTPNGDELVVNASRIHGYDPETGRELWSLGPTSVQVVASPVVQGERLIVSSGYPPARPIYAVKPGIRGDHEIESAANAEALAWYQTRGGAYMPTPLLYRGLLYMVHHNGRLVAHDAKTGDIVYRARLSAGGTCTSSPVVANGILYQGTEEGTLYVLAAGPEHRELAIHDIGEPILATPALSEGNLILRTPSRLIAIRGGAILEDETE